MSIVRIVQLLCPSRHAVLAAAYETPDGAEEPNKAEALRKQFQEFQKPPMNLNPWCGICESRELHTEDAATRYATIEEAWPALEETQRRNLATAEYFRQMRHGGQN